MNKRALQPILALSLVSALAAIPAAAQDAAPAIASPSTPSASASKLDRLVAPLNDVASLTVAEPTMVDIRNAADCKLDPKWLRQKLLAALAAEQLPLTPDNAAPRPDLVRLTLKPEVATLKDGVVNCVSWVSLSAQLQETLKLPPNADSKPVTITYWTRGALIMTPVIDHPTGVSSVYDKLAQVLGRQWRIDNPVDEPATPPSTATTATPTTNGLGNLKR